MSERMTEDDAFAFILERPQTAKLGCVRKDGRPHVVPVWVVVDEESDPRQIVFNVGDVSIKYKAMVRDPRVALCFEDDEPPFSFLTVEGTVTLNDDLEEMLPWSTRIGGRYMGADEAEAFGKRNAVAGEWLVRFTPTAFIGIRDMTG
jgi:PPOX class probable F420-dependent enzyme